MPVKIKRFFLLLVLIQGIHSIEEYKGRLWEVFLPAKFLTSLVSSNLKTGFLIINSGLLIFGLWCWFFPVRKNDPSARGFILFWIIIELMNGIGHLLWALSQWSYEPGLITAPFLFILGVLLIRQLSNSRSNLQSDLNDEN